MKNVYKCLFLILIFSSQGSALAGEDDDLGFLPPVKNEASRDLDTTKNQESLQIVNPRAIKFTLDNTLESSHYQGDTDKTFKLPNAVHSNWNNLTRLNMQFDKAVNNDLRFKTDILFNAYKREGEAFKSSEDLRLDIKEAYISWQKSPTLFFDVGRINVKNGIATGFNPTDYFKVGTILDRKTEDVSQLRDARLGALLIQGQKLWEGGAATLVVSPKVNYKANSWRSDKSITGLNLHKSNDRSRVLLKLTHEVSDGFSPELIYHNESGDHNLGLNLSKVLNKKMFVYVEWNIGNRRQLIDEAFLDARKTNQLLPTIKQKFGSDTGKQYLQQAAIGASYTSSSNITTKLEYHYNEAGLSKSDTKEWFDLGLNTNNPAVAGQLLSVRSLAQARGESLGKNRLFLYSTWKNAGVDDLDLTGLTMMDLNDHSRLMQMKLVYKPRKNSEVSLQFATFNGNKDSIYGSLDKKNTLSLGVKYDF